MFVESDHRAAAVIDQNIADLGVAGATVRRGSVAAVLAAAADRPVDLVLADPPYDVDAAEIEAVLTALIHGELDGARHRRRRRTPGVRRAIAVAGRLARRGRPAITATPGSNWPNGTELP